LCLRSSALFQVFCYNFCLTVFLQYYSCQFF
jgi:hypothetical protein